MKHKEGNNFRVEEARKKPQRYRCEETALELWLKVLKRRGAGAKALTTWKTKQMREISGHGSRTKVTYLKDKLAGTIEVYEQMMKLLDGSNQNENDGQKRRFKI